MKKKLAAAAFFCVVFGSGYLNRAEAQECPDSRNFLIDANGQCIDLDSLERGSPTSGTSLPSQGMPQISTALQRLIQSAQQRPTVPVSDLLPDTGARILTNGEGSAPMVRIYLKSPAALRAISRKLESLGAEIVATSSYGRGMVECFLLLDKIPAAANLAEVQSVTAVYEPFTRVGAVTSQAVQAQNVEPVLRDGILGRGIRVGVLSDSYNVSPTALTSADDDIQTGDLPGTGNPLGLTKPVVVLQDYPRLLAILTGSIDEGRAMMQLIHDIAPAAELGFATAFLGEVSFARNIVALQQDFDADVIVDDVGYFTSPFFSDGVISQAVDQVVEAGAIYFSAAGNSADTGFEDEFRAISPTNILNSSLETNIDFSELPSNLATTVHDFDPGSAVDITQNVTVAGGSTISFQWDEPFGFGKVETDYNLLVFDASGNFLPNLSGTDNNPAIDQPLEIISLPPGTYQIVIGRVNVRDTPARALKYVDFGGGLSGEYVGAPTIVGQPTARRGIAVGAAFYGTPNNPESFSSLGPARVFFDDQGNRLAQPQARLTPQIAGVDGTNTTFFFPGGDVEQDGFPNFFGTSAAAPNVAAVAALVLDAAGGSGSLTPLELKKVLGASATDINTPGPDFLSGVGLVNAEAAVNRVSNRR